ncbi:MAG: ArsR family transcriptional regulator [Flammeovirgaceae bacterium]
MNDKSRGYLRGLADEFGESTNAIRIELNRFEDANMLESELEGNKRFYRANTQHPLFHELQNIIKKFVGIDQIVERISKRLGNVQKVYLEGDLAKGIDSNIIDIMLVGEGIDRPYLSQLLAKAEQIVKKHIRYRIVTEDITSTQEENVPNLLIWTRE